MFKRFYTRLHQLYSHPSAQNLIADVTRWLAIASIISGVLVMFPSGFLPIPPAPTRGAALLLNALVLLVVGIAAANKGEQP